MQKNVLQKCKRLFAIVLFSLSVSLYAATGVLSGEKNLRVSKTQWFDIIYPERCEKSAAILYENADEIYSEVTEQYGLKPNARIPIVITPAVENFNAFWAVVPYSHIVLYDTSSDSMNELTVFSETLLSTFRHELTHAVTFTMKNGFWSGVTKIFGDAINIGPLLVSSGMAEGATVTSESAAGEGRLNDEYAMHFVKQAKIENRFPAYYGVQGAGDLNPYYFNGAFHEWLQNKYGMEAYSKFWYYTINVQGLTVRRRFKKAFGEKLDKAWKEFKQDFEVPAVEKNPVENQQVQDFFIPDNKKYSSKNNGGSLYTNLSSSKENLYWLDKSSRNIFITKKTDSESEIPKYKKLLTQTGAYDLGPSSDDRFLAISCYTDDEKNVAAKVKIFDLQTKRIFTIKETGLKDAAVFTCNGDYYLVASKFIAPNNSIQIFKIVLNERDGGIAGVRKISEKILPLNVFAAEYTPWKEGFAYVEKNQLDYSICISDVEGQVLYQYKVPEERMVIHSLSADEQSLYFSWAKSGTMPRYGKLNLEQKEFVLAQYDLSGGVFTPVSDGNRIVYIGNFLNQNRILSFIPDYENDYCSEPVQIQNQINIESEEDLSFYGDYEIPQSADFNSFKYLTRGIFVPLSFYTSEYFGPNYGKTPSVDNLYIGASYYTGAPWSDGTSDTIIFTGGWNYFSKSVGLELQTNFGTSTSLFTSKVDLKNEFDIDGWKLSSGELTLGTGFHFGKISSLKIQNILQSKVGRQSPWIVTKKQPFLGYFVKDNGTVFYNFYDNLAFLYSTAHYSGPGTYEISGISAIFGAYYLTDGAIDDSILRIKTYDLYGSVKGYISRLLPLDSSYGFTTNLPSTVEIKILPASAKSISIYEVTTDTVLFGTLIKRPMPLVNGIYLQNWKISAGYSGAFEPTGKNVRSGCQFVHIFDYTNQIFAGEFEFVDSVSLKADLIISPNMGILARNEFQADIYGLLKYNFHTRKDETNITFDFGVNLSF